MAGALWAKETKFHGFDPDKRQWRGDWYPVFICAICG